MTIIHKECGHDWIMSYRNFLYFAYGSNMLPERLQARCVSARFISLARVADYDIVFSKPSGDGSAKATLVKKGGASTPGVLFAIARYDLPALDRAEGAGSGYKRIDSFTLEDRTGALVTATTYIASENDIAYGKDPSLKPYDWYLA